MIVVILFEPTLVVITSSPAVTGPLADAASCPANETTHGMPPPFLVRNRYWRKLRWIRLNSRVTWELNSFVIENIWGFDEICCEEEQFLVDCPFSASSVMLGLGYSFTISF